MRKVHPPARLILPPSENVSFNRPIVSQRTEFDWKRFSPLFEETGRVAIPALEGYVKTDIDARTFVQYAASAPEKAGIPTEDCAMLVRAFGKIHVRGPVRIFLFYWLRRFSQGEKSIYVADFFPLTLGSAFSGQGAFFADRFLVASAISSADANALEAANYLADLNIFAGVHYASSMGQLKHFPSATAKKSGRTQPF